MKEDWDSLSFQSRHDIQLTIFFEAIIEKLKQHLPLTTSVHNPVDVLDDTTCERDESDIRDILTVKKEGLSLLPTQTYRPIIVFLGKS